MRNAALLAVLLTAPSAASAQNRGLAMDRAIDFHPWAEPVDLSLIGPDHDVIDARPCAGTCQIPIGWWRGPGLYALEARAGDRAGTVVFELRGDEIELHPYVRPTSMEPPTVDVAINVVRTDPRIRVTVVTEANGVVEVVNDTDIELRVAAQDYGLHWEIEPTDPVLSEADRRALTVTTRHGCATDSWWPRIAPRSIVRTAPLNPVRGGRLPAGGLRGIVTLEAVEDRQPNVHESWVATFLLRPVDATQLGRAAVRFLYSLPDVPHPP